MGSASLGRGAGMDGQRVDIGLHHAAKCGVHGAMPRNRRQALEGLADHRYGEMPAPVTSLCVPRVQVAVVLDIQMMRGEGLLQCNADTVDAIGVAHGNTLRNGRTSVRT